MGVITRAFTFTGTPTEAQWNVDIDAIISEITGQLDSANCDTTSSDAIMTLDVAQTKTARQTFSGGVILDELLSTANAGSGHVKIADIRWDAGGGSLADNDGLYLAFTGDDSGAAETEYMRLALNFDDVTATNEDASLVTSLMKAGTLTSITTLTNLALSPTTTDAVSLGTSSLNWSDLFLDSGAVINFDSGNVTLTHSASSLTASADTVTFASANSTDPVITIKNTTNDANGPRLQFVHDKGAAGADNDLCGQIEFIGDDDNQDLIPFAKISGQVADASNGDECGKLNLLVAENDGNLTAGLVLTGSTTDGEVDVTVGAGAASVTTVAGLMTVTGIATLASSSTVGNLTLANGSITDSSGAISFGNENLTTTGTVGIGTSTTDPTGWGAGYTVTTVGSATSGSVLNLQNSSTSLSNNARVGTLDFVAGGGSPAPIARVEASVAGTSEAGGWLNFYVRPDGGSLTEAMRIDSAGNVGIGGLHGSPSVFEVWGGEASASTPTLKVADGVVSVGAANNDANVVFTVEDRLGNDFFITDTANSRVQMPRGTVYIGLDTSNANMTQGLTINQDGSDDEAFALKSSDVVHPMTALAEADTYGHFTKVDGVAGGFWIEGFKDADGAANQALALIGSLGEAASTDDTTSSWGVTSIRGRITDGSTGVTVVANSGNLISFQNSTTCRLLIKGNGDLHATNITSGSGDLDGVALDDEDDVGLIRAMERFTHNDVGIAMTKWDEEVKANEADLRRVGVLTGDFYSIQRYQSLLGGGIWQNRVRMNGMAEGFEKIIEVQEKRITALEKTAAQLTA